MAVVGGVSVDLTADAGIIVKEMERAARSVEASSTKMASSSSKFGSFFSNLGNQAKGLGNTFNRASQGIRSIVGPLANIGGLAGGASVAGLVALGKRASETADTMIKAADLVGLSAESYQALAFQAGLAGVEQGTLNSALEIFAARMGEAKAGTGTLATTMAKLNPVLAEALKGAKNQEEALRIVSDAMAAATTQTDRLAIARAAFGRSGGALTLALKGGSAELDEFRKKAEALGIVFTEKMARDAELLNDTLSTLSQVIQANLGKALLEAAPQMQRLAQAFVDAAPAIAQITQAIVRFATAVLENLGPTVDRVLAVKRAFNEIGEAVGLNVAGDAIKSFFSDAEEGAGRATEATERFNRILEGSAAILGSGAATPAAIGAPALATPIQATALPAAVSVPVEPIVSPAEEQTLERVQTKFVQVGQEIRDAGAALRESIGNFNFLPGIEALFPASEHVRQFAPALSEADKFMQELNASSQQTGQSVQTLNEHVDQMFVGSGALEQSTAIAAENLKSATAVEQELASRIAMSQVPPPRAAPPPAFDPNIQRLDPTLQADAAFAEKLTDDMQQARFEAYRFETAIGDAMGAMILEGADAGDTMQALARRIRDMVIEMLIIMPIAHALGAALQGALGGGAPIGGLLFGGFRQHGGRTQGGKAYVVGEKGPELWMDNRSGFVVSNDNLKRLQAGSGGNSVNIGSINQDNRGATAEMAQVARRAAWDMIPAIQQAVAVKAGHDPKYRKALRGR